ncbi:DUF2188 domain-containing protein [Plantactinospora sonchi]|uniref:DUF2188 domain-containing protein n=1 Tax=Plantactinospora sonchi TaxID=1544735 RepID=UPI002F266ECD
MSTRSEYHVVPADGRWAVEKGSTVTGTYDTKDQAIEQGRKAAKGALPSQLVVHKADGQIETEYTYRDDPYPPQG